MNNYDDDENKIITHAQNKHHFVPIRLMIKL